ncbi:unnamed protein product [Allacma fusca]|uniref:Uncharacterized protein n=1 Tax=Allacma fusca TaxID=39272 RepID=A0A8J2JXR9_9HEXA|nr:unnamed protein product [Allacma fusca]
MTLATSVGERLQLQKETYEDDREEGGSNVLPPHFFTKEKSIFYKILDQVVLPGKPHVSIEDVSGCNNVALIDFRSAILNFKVPKSRRRTVLSNPFLMGKESILQGLSGWGISDFHGSKLFQFLGKLMESGVFKRVRVRLAQLYQPKSSLKYLQSLPRSVGGLNLESEFIQALFFMFSFLSAICLGFLLAEVMTSVRRACHRKVRIMSDDSSEESVHMILLMNVGRAS